MRSFETGMQYFRKVALEVGLILESDNEDEMVKRIAKCITHKCPEVVKAPTIVLKKKAKKKAKKK